jgi:hypothetical protein
VRLNFIIGVGFIIVSLFSSCGTTGHIRFYDYNVPKDTLQYIINQFLEKNPSYKFPSNDLDWQKYHLQDSSIIWMINDKDQVEAQYIHGKKTRDLIYFKQTKEEVYWIGYSGDEKYWKEHPTNSRLALIGFSKKGKYCLLNNRLGLREKKRIEKRFEKEVLFKLPYPYLKVKK